MKDILKMKQQQRERRKRRIRRKLIVTGDRPRLSVFRSLKHISGQIVGSDGRVMVAASDHDLSDVSLKGVARAAAVGKALGEKAKAKNITAVVFDKGHYTYHGQVKAFADAVREEGL